MIVDSSSIPKWIAQLGTVNFGLSLDPLLVRCDLGSSEGRTQFLTELIAWSAGQRTYEYAAGEFLRLRDYPQAARCAKKVQSSALGRRVVEELCATHGELVQQLDELKHRMQKLPSQRTTEEWLELVRSELSSMDMWLGEEQPIILEKLSALSLPHPWEDAATALAAAHIEIQQLEDAIKKRQAEERSQLLQLSRRANGIADELLLEQTAAEIMLQADSLRAAVRSALQEQDLPKLRELVHSFEMLKGGRLIGLPPSAQSPPADLLASSSENLPKTQLSGAIPVVTIDDLSDIVRMDLRRSDGTELPLDMPAYSPRDFDRQRLKLYAAHAKPQAAANDPKLLGQYLDAWAKQALLKKEFERAQIAFIDLIRWASAAGVEPRQRDVAAWGLLLSLILPHVPKDERQRAMEPRNLSSLCERKIGTFPLLRFEQLGLLPELAVRLVRIGMPTVRGVLNQYLIPYLTASPVAAEEFTCALIEELPQQTSPVLEMLGFLLAELLATPELERECLLLARSIEHRAQKLSALREPIDALSEHLLELADTWNLAARIRESLASLRERLLSTHSTSGYQISHNLLTPEVELSEGNHLVIEVSAEGTSVLHGLYTQPLLCIGSHKNAEKIPGAFAPINPVARLAPGQTIELVVPFASLAEPLCQATYLEIQHSIPDSEGIKHSIPTHYRGFSVVVSQPPVSVLASPPNPYTCGLPLEAPESIFGRERIITEICENLIGRQRDNAVLLLGDRRIGKTTVLNLLQKDRRISDRYITLYKDFQYLTPDSSIAAFLRDYLMHPIQTTLQANGLPRVNYNEGLLASRPLNIFADFMARIDQILASNPRRLLLILDEFETLLQAIDQAQRPADMLGPEVLAALRSVIQQSRYISLLLSGVTYIVRRHTAQPDNRLSRFASEVTIKPIDENSAQLLVRLPARAQYEVHKSAVDWILRETARQPYLIQKLCHPLYADMMRRRAKVATRSDVQRVIEQVLLPDASSFVHLSQPMQSQSDRQLVYSLAALQSGNRYVSLSDLARHLRRQRATVEEPAIHARLRQLTEESPSVIEKHPISPYQFRLTVGLYARHLRQSREEQSSLVVVPTPTQ